MRGGGWVALIGMLGLTCVACGSSPTEASPASVIRAYVNALQRDDFDAAMALRCESNRVDANKKDLFLADVGRLRDAAGGELKVGELRELHPVRLVHNGVPFEHEFMLRLAGRDAASSPIHIGIFTKGGSPNVCGWSVDESFDVRVELATETMEANPTHVDDVRTLVERVSSAIGGEIQDDQATKGTDHSAVEGWTVGWRTGSYGGGRLSTMRYATTESALSHANEIIDSFAPDSTATFDVPSLRGARALRYTGLAWTGIQPSDLGAQADVAVLVCDDTVIWLTASGIDPEEDHAKLMTIAEDIRSFLG